MQVIVADTTASGQETARLLLDDVPSPILLRDLITCRVREEVARFNARPAALFSGLVQPTGSEWTLDGYALRQPRTLDWQQQAETALEAFRHNGFFVFIGDRQAGDLGEGRTAGGLAAAMGCLARAGQGRSAGGNRFAATAGRPAGNHDGPTGDH